MYMSSAFDKNVEYDIIVHTKFNYIIKTLKFLSFI